MMGYRIEYWPTRDSIAQVFPTTYPSDYEATEAASKLRREKQWQAVRIVSEQKIFSGEKLFEYAVVGFDATADGFVKVNELGEVAAGGRVPFMGSLAGIKTAPIGGIKLTPSGNGYWIWCRDGSVHPFGAASDTGGMTFA